MKYKRIIPIMLSVICIMQLCGCGLLKKDEAKIAIQNGESLEIKVSNSDTVQYKSDTDNTISWVPLASNKTYTKEGFRSNFDRAFNTNIVTTTEGNSKQGCLFVVSYNGEDAQSTNTTMRDAFRNESFNQYIDKPEVQNDIAEAIEKAYIDIDKTSKDTFNAAINAYYGLLIDEDDDPQYNKDRAVTRDQFYSALYKSMNPVQDLELDSSYCSAIGGETPYTIYTQQIADNGWLTVANGGLNKNTISSPITKFEALYLVANTVFPDEMAKIEVSKNASAFGFQNNEKLLKQLGIIDKEGTLVIQNWQPNVMMYTLSNPDKGMCPEMIKALGVAGKTGLMSGIGSDLSASISRNEVIKMFINAFKAENKLNGYLTHSEYPKLSLIETVEEPEELELEDLTEIQMVLIENVYTEVYGLEELTIEEKQAKEEDILNSYIDNGDLPVNGVALYYEWKSEIHPDEELTDNTIDTGIIEETEP